ncbi:MAG: hypothetical protein HY784_18535, partial [Chloroflexi bacterium]|nr:hypothetical protein [Chloroflexota bacterium]
TADLLAVKSLPAAAVPEGAYSSLAEAEGKVLSVARVSGDPITDYVAGENEASGIPAQLEADTVAISVKVDLATGLAGVVRPGQYVTVIGIIDPQHISQGTSSFSSTLPDVVVEAGATPAPTPTPPPPASSAARIAVTGLKVLVVPQSFRYEELPASTSDQELLFSNARTTSQQGSVILLQASVEPLEIAPGLFASPAEILALLNQTAVIHLALEPAGGLHLDHSVVYGVDLARLYEAITGITLRP